MAGEVEGMRFFPTDVEVIRYLRKRSEGTPLPPGLIHEFDVYSQEPWNLPRDFMRGIGEEVYYVTPRHKATARGNGCRANRNVGEGFWHGNGRDQLIFDDESSKPIGHKTSFVFKFRDNEKKRLHTNWIMHEYLLHLPRGKFQEMALCRIHPKKENKEAENDYLAAHDCKRRRIHVAMSTLFDDDQAYEVGDGGNGEDIAMVTATRIEQHIASQLVSLPGCIEELMLSESGTPANVLAWIESFLAADDGMEAQPSSFATKGGSSGEDVARLIAIEQELAPLLVPPPGPIDDRSTSITISSTSGDRCFIDSDTLKWADSLISTLPSSPISISSSSQRIEEHMSSESGTPSVPDVLVWSESMLAVDDGMEVQPSSFPIGSSISHLTSIDISE